MNSIEFHLSSAQHDGKYCGRGPTGCPADFAKPAGRFQGCKGCCMVRRRSSKNCTSRIDWSPKNQSGPRRTVVESSFGTIAESGPACHASQALCQQPWKSCVFCQWSLPICPPPPYTKLGKNSQWKNFILFLNSMNTLFPPLVGVNVLGLNKSVYFQALPNSSV